MTDQLDATKALTHRLREWGVDNSAERATQFIGDLVARGWAMSANVRPIRRPPTKAEECGVHPGEYRDFCRCCVSDRKAARELAENGPRLTEDEARSELRKTVAAARSATKEPTAERDREPLHRGDDA